MPTYEYLCDACHANHEEFQKITADALKVCPSCGRDKLRRLISGGAGIIFKGTGWTPKHYPQSGDRSRDMENLV